MYDSVQSNKMLFIFRKHKLAQEMLLKEHLVFGKGDFLCYLLEFELKSQLLL